jgi:hypothetical protein
MVTGTRRVASGIIAATGAIGLLTAGSAAPASAQAAPCVQNIAVLNNAAFVMSFLVSTRTGITSAPTDNYPVNQYRVINLTSTPITVGEDVRPVVTAVAGDTVASPTFVSYCTNGQTATYAAYGTTLNFSVTLPS